MKTKFFFLCKTTKIQPFCFIKSHDQTFLAGRCLTEKYKELGAGPQPSFFKFSWRGKNQTVFCSLGLHLWVLGLYWVFTCGPNYYDHAHKVYSDETCLWCLFWLSNCEHWTEKKYQKILFRFFQFFFAILFCKRYRLRFAIVYWLKWKTTALCVFFRRMTAS